MSNRILVCTLPDQPEFPAPIIPASQRKEYVTKSAAADLITIAIVVKIASPPE